ncbi:MAG: hypothetical protein P4L43_14585 [Syntrophobacteraceae bacterium]|nr:hypothetical protein [Syntrophobacteraceae bacterium]
MAKNYAAADVFGDIYPPRQIRVLGAGRFGRIAVERLRGRFPGALLTVYDRDKSRVAQISEEFKICGEAAECLASMGGAKPDEEVWFIPSVPVHVAFEWVLSELAPTGNPRRLSVPQEVDLQVPNPMRSPSGALYASFASFLCPDNCNEPDQLCTHTGKNRPGNLYELLEGIHVPGFEVFVQRSRQLAPGVGGYPGRSLRELAARVAQKPGACLVATSCRCHAVINALEWSA